MRTATSVSPSRTRRRAPPSTRSGATRVSVFSSVSSGPVSSAIAASAVTATNMSSFVVSGRKVPISITRNMPRIGTPEPMAHAVAARIRSRPLRGAR